MLSYLYYSFYSVWFSQQLFCFPVSCKYHYVRFTLYCRVDGACSTFSQRFVAYPMRFCVYLHWLPSGRSPQISEGASERHRVYLESYKPHCFSPAASRHPPRSQPQYLLFFASYPNVEIVCNCQVWRNVCTTLSVSHSFEAIAFPILHIYNYDSRLFYTNCIHLYWSAVLCCSYVVCAV